MSIALIGFSFLFYSQKGYQLDLQVAQLQSEYDLHPSETSYEELLNKKSKIFARNSKTNAFQWHDLGIQQLRKGLFEQAQVTFEKSFKLMVSTDDFLAEEAAYLKARIANTILMQNDYKPNVEVNELLAESLAFAQSNLADELNQYITMYNDVEFKGEKATAMEIMRVGIALYEFGEYKFAKPYILKAANKAVSEGDNLPLAARAFAISAQITLNLNSNEFTPEVLKLVGAAFTNNQNDSLALQLAGEYAFSNEEYDIAYQTLSILVKDPYYASSLTDDLVDKYSKTLFELGKESEMSGLIQVKVDIDPSLKSIANKGKFLFVLARPVGQRMPLGVKKIPMSQVTFPLTVYLSDLNAMTPQMTISSQDQVEIVARVSLSGIANAATGEPESEALLLTKDINKVSIKINKIH
ncbi:MAG: hypothetical protein HRU38_19375 [Saccharospirillaceae bacterium]|nr:hypothetical protein [Pseudomonadales bacterium]NRB80798.1 hypothetical protein [Saccharospirillaceae bacterium]